MLSDPENQEIVTKVLAQRLQSLGFERANVKGGHDQEGEPALFVEAFFSLPSDRVRAHDLVDAQVALIDALNSRGEARFPYLTYRFPGELEPLPDDVEARLENIDP